MEKGFNTFLTVILILCISAMVVLAGFWIYDVYQKNKTEKEALAAIDELNKWIEQNKGKNQLQNNINGIITAELENTVVQNNNVYQESDEPEEEVNVFEGFTILGYIEIPKTGVYYPILAETSVDALARSICLLYGPGLNKVGNTILIGHNNRNGLFFSNNKKLEIGDIIYITDSVGNRVTYTIYNKYETTDTDADYFNRDTEGMKEISLSTCTDNGKMRIIIWARAE